ncbi:MAG: cation transporter [Chloroflexi bacterium HGW-Chloroflexi-10]|nr:MAG: cation transporter [Chloroflexi bacterium HGW-Chloroflexi-10]
MQWVRKQSIDPEKNKLYRRAMIFTLGGNIILALAKALAAYFSGSVALFADAANSISDVVYSFMMVWGLRVSQQPADISHPQGHSRFEPIVGLLVTASMTLAGYQAAKAAISRMLAGGLAIDPGLPTLILLAGAVIKLGMFYFIRNIGKKLNSPTLKTAAKDNLSDVSTSGAAFLGVFLSSFIHPLLDPVAGILVSGWIFRNAFEAGKENLAYLTGAGATDEQRAEFVNIAKAVPGVSAVHHLMTEYVGPQLVLDMHINVDGNLTLNQSHAIADQIIDALEALPDVDRAYIHVEPDGWE